MSDEHAEPVSIAISWSTLKRIHDIARSIMEPLVVWAPDELTMAKNALASNVRQAARILEQLPKDPANHFTQST